MMRVALCWRPLRRTLLIFCVVLFIFMVIPVPQTHYNQEADLHQAQCQPSGESYTLIIHQIWLNYTAFPEKWKLPMDQCRQLNKDYKYRLWTAQDIMSFLEKNFAWFIPTYNAYPYNVQRVDAARLFLLYHYGGVYMDMDLGCIRSFSNITSELRNYDVILSRGATFGVSNHIMLAKPGDPYLRLAIENLAQYNRWFLIPYTTIMYSAGPGFLTVMFRDYTCKELIFVFPPEPEHNQYYTNLHGGSWHTWDTKIIDTLGAIHKTIKYVFTWYSFMLFVCISVVVYMRTRHVHSN